MERQCQDGGTRELTLQQPDDKVWESGKPGLGVPRCVGDSDSPTEQTRRGGGVVRSSRKTDIGDHEKLTFFYVCQRIKTWDEEMVKT